MKIAIVVHGRFHAFDLARAMLERGHDVTVYTNYPGWATERFGLPRRYVRSFSLHGVLCRMVNRMGRPRIERACEPLLHRLFGRWAAAQLRGSRWDLIHSWSGVSEELFSAKIASSLHTIMRGSAHIRVQDRLLAEEGQRAGAPIHRPSSWMIGREEREYQLADQIVVLSSFAHQSFLEQGVLPERLAKIPLGVDTIAFRPPRQVITERLHRIRSGAPLQLLYTGAMSFQKGMWDLAAVLRKLDPARFQMSLVGAPTPELAGLLPELRRLATLVPHQPQSRLVNYYNQSDLYLFPTIQDGFATVLAQAHAASLPILCTTNCSGPDLLRQGLTGWVLPIRSPEAFVERLLWCDTHREELAVMAEQIYTLFYPRSWQDVSADFEALCTQVRAS